MQITITINTGNAAFEDDNGTLETARILRDVSERLERARHVWDVQGKLRDVNGNTCGEVRIEEGD